MVACHRLEGVNRLQRDGFVLAFEVHTPVEEGNSLPERIFSILVQHIHEVSQEERVASLDQLTLVVDDLRYVVVEGTFHDRKDVAVLVLRVHVAQQAKDGDGCIDDDVWLGMLHETAALAQLLVLFGDVDGKLAEIESFLATFFAQRLVQRVHTEESDQSHGAVDVVAKSLDQLRGLGLDDVGLLPVTGVEGQADELLRVVVHLLPLRLRGLDHLQADVKDQVWQILQENELELLVLGNAVVQLEKLDYEI